MSTKNNISLLIILLIIAVILYLLLFYNNSHNFKLVYVEKDIDYNIEKKLISDLNAKADKRRINKQIDYYVGGFYSEFKRKVINKNNFNILRLGSFAKIDMETVKQYDLVLPSNNDLDIYLKNSNINSFFIPAYNFVDDKDIGSCANGNGDNCYWLMIGNLASAELYMKNNNIKYKKYNDLSLIDVKEISNQFNNISGVIVGRSRISQLSYDIYPIFLEFIIRKIPILTESLKPITDNEFTDTLHHFLFSDAISYYTYPSDIDYFFSNLEYRMKKTSYAFDFFVNFISTDAVSSRILDILNIKENNTHKKKIVSIFSPTFVGLYNNGDYWVAKDIEAKFKELGYRSLIYFPSSQISNIGDIDIYIRGGIPLPKRMISKDRFSIMYFLFPFFNNEEKFNTENFDMNYYIDEIKDELLKFDAVAIASEKLVTILKNKYNFNVYYVPQFTDLKKFYYDYDEKLKSEILFVGNKTFYRKAPAIVLENNLPITIYGDNWGDVAKAKYVDNQILRKYYSSAKIVLNDTRESMKTLGFVINRIFDVTACNGFIISDYVKEVEEIYGDSVPMYKTDEELIDLLKYYLDPKNEQERLEKAQRAYEITINNFTADIISNKFENIIKDLEAQRRK